MKGCAHCIGGYVFENDHIIDYCTCIEGQRLLKLQDPEKYRTHITQDLGITEDQAELLTPSEMMLIEVASIT